MSAPTVLPAARYQLASFGELLGDSSRAAMLLSLRDGHRAVRLTVTGERELQRRFGLTSAGAG